MFSVKDRRIYGNTSCLYRDTKRAETRSGYTVLPKELKRGGMSGTICGYTTGRHRQTAYRISCRRTARRFYAAGTKMICRNIQIYEKNDAVRMEAPDSVGIWYCGEKHTVYLDEMSRCGDGLELFRLPASGNTGRRDYRRRIWKMHRGLFSFFYIWKSRGHKRSRRETEKLPEK